MWRGFNVTHIISHATFTLQIGTQQQLALTLLQQEYKKGGGSRPGRDDQHNSTTYLIVTMLVIRICPPSPFTKQLIYPSKGDRLKTVTIVFS